MCDSSTPLSFQILVPAAAPERAKALSIVSKSRRKAFNKTSLCASYGYNAANVVKKAVLLCEVGKELARLYYIRANQL